MKDIEKEPRGEELIRRYKENYSIPLEAPVTEEMILSHWDLEKKLAKELIESKPENRREVFESAYGRLYHELEWLNKFVHTSTQNDFQKQYYSRWIDVIGETSLSIYEIGSGKGAMITYLSQLGHKCTGTEITSERGEKFVSTETSVSWVITDGVHLDLYEEVGKYDLILSDQVIEHLHPDDIKEHFESALRILKPNGRYIFNTPHLFLGPADVSAVFGCSAAKGMHLKEYKFRELIKTAKKAGFKKTSYAYKFTDVLKKTKISSILNFFGFGYKAQKKMVGNIYLRVLLTSEWLLSLIPTIKFRKKVSSVLNKMKLFNGNIFIEAKK